MWSAPICFFLDSVGITVQDVASLYCIAIFFFIFNYAVDEQFLMKKKFQSVSSDEIIIDVKKDPLKIVEIAFVPDHQPHFTKPDASFRLDPTAYQVEALVMDALFAGERTLRRRRARLTFIRGFRAVSKAFRPTQHSKQTFSDASTSNSTFYDGPPKKQRMFGRLRKGITKRPGRKRNVTAATTCQSIASSLLDQISFNGNK